MRLDVKRDEEPLSGEERAWIEKRLRLTIGARSADIRTLQLRLRPEEPLPSVRWRVTLRHRDDSVSVLEDSSPDPSDALEQLLWRMGHHLDRRALRR